MSAPKEGGPTPSSKGGSYGTITIKHTNGPTLVVERSPDTNLTVGRILTKLRKKEKALGALCVATFTHQEASTGQKIRVELMLYTCTLFDKLIAAGSVGAGAAYELSRLQPPPATCGDSADEIMNFCLRAVLHIPMHHIIMRYRLPNIPDHEEITVTTDYTIGCKPEPLAIMIMELAHQYANEIVYEPITEHHLFG